MDLNGWDDGNLDALDEMTLDWSRPKAAKEDHPLPPKKPVKKLPVVVCDSASRISIVEKESATPIPPYQLILDAPPILIVQRPLVNLNHFQLSPRYPMNPTMTNVHRRQTVQDRIGNGPRHRLRSLGLSPRYSIPSKSVAKKSSPHHPRNPTTLCRVWPLVV